MVVTVKEIRGNCPVFKVGDRIVVESPKIVVDQTDNICYSCFQLYALYDCSFKSWNKLQTVLSTEEGEKGYIQCLDPRKPYTNGGTVLFEIKRERI